MSSGTLTLFERSPNDLLYGYALSSAYKSQWVYDPSYALKNEADIWEIVRNDAVFKGCMNRCTRAVVRPWRITPARHTRKREDRLIADICWDGLSHIDEFDARRRRQADAIFLARTYSMILWQRQKMSLADTQEMDWWVPVQLQDIDRRRVHWVADWKRADPSTYSGDGRYTVTSPAVTPQSYAAANNPPPGMVKSTHLEMFDTNTNSWQIVTPSMRQNMIEWIYENTEDRVGYGRGLLEAIYFYHYMKTITFEKISQGIDRWANGIWTVKLDSLRNASSSKTNTALVTTAKNMIRNMRSEHIAVLGDGDNIEVLETSGSGHQAAMEFLHYLDDEVERLINGSIRASGMGGSNNTSGSLAQSKTEAETTESYHQDDRDGLDAVYDRDLLGAFLRVNRLNFMKLGLDKAKRPKFSSEQINKQDPLVAVQVAQALVNVGFDISKAELSEKSNFSIPGPDEDTIKGVRMDMAGMGIDPKDGFPNPKAPPKDPNKKPLSDSD